MKIFKYLIPILLLASTAIAQPAPPPGVSSIAKSGSAKIRGDVTLSEGSNITLTQVGKDISIASIGSSGISIGDPIGSGTSQSVLFVDASGDLAQDNPGLVYNPTTNYLTAAGGIISQIMYATDGSDTIYFAPAGIVDPDFNGVFSNSTGDDVLIAGYNPVTDTHQLGSITQVGGVTTIPSTVRLSGLTASLPVKTDASKNLTAAAINLASAEVTGVLPVANGGSGTSTAFTAGSVVFAGASGTYTQDNANFFWDNTSKELGIGTASPGSKLHVTKDSTQSETFMVGDDPAIALGSGYTLATIMDATNIPGLLVGKDATHNLLFNWSGTAVGGYGVLETYGNSNALVLQATTGKVGLNNFNTTLMPGGLNFGQALGMKIAMYPVSSTAGYGFGISASTLEIIAPSVSGANRVAIMDATGSTVTSQIATAAGTETVINEQSKDSDTRIEGDTNANLFFLDASTDRIGINNATPSAKLHPIATTEQLRLGYDASNYLSTTVASNGATTLNATGAGAAFTFSDAVTLSSTLTFSTAASQIIPGATSFAVRNNANSADNLLISNAGALTARTSMTATSGAITATSGNFVAASGYLVFNTTDQGVTSDTVDGSDNQKVIIQGAGDSGTYYLGTRGAALELNGNEAASAGAWTLYSGTTASVNVFRAMGTSSWSFRDSTNANNLSISSAGVMTFPNLTASTPLKLNSSKEVISADIDLTTDVTGVLPTANGGSTSGNFTPTLTNVTNVAASTAYSGQWSRDGNIVTGSGTLDIDTTTGSVATVIGISLPVASNFAIPTDASGVISSGAIFGLVGSVRGDSTNDRFNITFISDAAAGNYTFTYTFSYTVI